MWGKCEEFITVVDVIWAQEIEGYKMYQVVRKLKMLKHPLKYLNKQNFGNIEVAATVTGQLLHDLQCKVHNDPCNGTLQEEERLAAKTFMELEEARRSFLAQKAKMQWMNNGDDNTHFFYCPIKARRMHNKILNIKDMMGTEQAASLIREVTSNEIKTSLFSIPSDKAPGPDGFTSQIFKDAFPLLGTDILAAVHEFFSSGKLLQ
ncbi:uncharacterized protein LOC141618378 [Silene latifolia]|uniref:uncharacterized protein LOC141618378 n=1 Tax=Silene latifolia TaxID=37657 RepID=UPI003D76B0C3